MASAIAGVPPQSELDVTVELVADLLHQQHEDLAGLPLQIAEEGWDNVTLRLGDELAVRVPRREASARLIDNEVTWLPYLAPHLSLPIPTPVRTGRPTDDYPWSWMVVPWIDGQQALVEPLLPSEAVRLGSFLRELHEIEIPPDPPLNPFRGVALVSRLEFIEERLEQFGGHPDGADHAGLARATCDAGVAAAMDTPSAWLHGDLHPKNIVSDNGRIAAVVDWGDICSGDVATDLASAWMLFDNDHHADFWSAYGEVSDETMMRARAWAVSLGLMIWANHYAADPIFAASGLRAIHRATQPRSPS